MNLKVNDNQYGRLLVTALLLHYLLLHLVLLHFNLD